jgi:threonine dehydrogenase-like Zn-dependent dehydrogenase
VASAFTTSCGDCFYCRKGLTCRCRQGQLFGWVVRGTGLEGGQAEYVRVPLAEGTLMAVPEGVSPEEALLLGDVLATGFFCAAAAEVGPGTTCAVVGCGPVGLLAILGARELGAEVIFALDHIPARLALAEAFGALGVDAGSRDALASICERTEGRGVDAVLEAVGSPEAGRLAVELVRPGGIVSAAGVHTEEHFPFSPAEAYDKNLTFKIGRCPARYYMERLFPLVQQKKYPFSRVITHRLPLSEGARAYAMFDQKEDGCIKVLLAP